MNTQSIILNKIIQKLITEMNFSNQTNVPRTFLLHLTGELLNF